MRTVDIQTYINTDILYLGCNMGNCGYRFFKRYPQAEEDYYDTFRWLNRIKKCSDYTVAIKHHGGHYRKENDPKELQITDKSGILYIDNQLDSYQLASKAKMVVSYFSTMILELNGYPHLSYFIREKRKEKRHLFRVPCNRPETPYIKGYSYPPSYFLDPHKRNKHFCKYIDEHQIHNCEGCKPPYLEIYEPYRIYSFNEFKKKARSLCK